MTAGLRVWNQYGVLQIDGEHKNLALQQKGTVTCNSLFYIEGHAYYKATLTVSGRTAPLMVTRNGFDLYNVSKSGSTYTYTFISATNGGNVNYWLFDAGVSAGSSYGLRIYNSAGELVFHSGAPALRVMDFVYNDGSTGSGLISYPTGRTYGVACSHQGWVNNTATEQFSEYPSGDDGSGQSNTYVPLPSWTNANTMRIQWDWIAETPYYGPPHVYPAAPFHTLVVDLTNL